MRWRISHHSSRSRRRSVRAWLSSTTRRSSPRRRADARTTPSIRLAQDHPRRARSSHSPAAARANAWVHSRSTPARSHRPTARNDPRTARLARPSRRLLASPPRAPSRTSPPAAPPRPPSPSPAPSPRTTSPAPSFHRPRRRARTSPPRLSPRRSRRRPGPRGSDTSHRSRTSRTTAAPGTRAGKSYTRTLRARSRPVIRTAAPARASPRAFVAPRVSVARATTSASSSRVRVVFSASHSMSARRAMRDGAFYPRVASRRVVASRARRGSASRVIPPRLSLVRLLDTTRNVRAHRIVAFDRRAGDARAARARRRARDRGRS